MGDAVVGKGKCWVDKVKESLPMPELLIAPDPVGGGTETELS